MKLVRSALKEVINNRKQLAELSLKIQELVDGKGVDRVKEKMEAGFSDTT